MYAMLGKKKKKIIPFSQEILLTYLWALQQNASECVGSVNEIMRYSFLFHAMLMDYDLDWLPSFDSQLVKGQFGASCLWHLELEG